MPKLIPGCRMEGKGGRYNGGGMQSGRETGGIREGRKREGWGHEGEIQKAVKKETEGCWKEVKGRRKKVKRNEGCRLQRAVVEMREEENKEGNGGGIQRRKSKEKSERVVVKIGSWTKLIWGMQMRRRRGREGCRSEGGGWVFRKTGRVSHQEKNASKYVHQKHNIDTKEMAQVVGKVKI